MRWATRYRTPGSFVFKVGGLVSIAFCGWFGILRYRVHGNDRAASFTWPIRLSALRSEVTGLVTVVRNFGPRLWRLFRKRGTGPGPRLGNGEGAVDIGMPGWHGRGVCHLSRPRTRQLERSAKFCRSVPIHLRGKDPNLQKMEVAERMEPEPSRGRKNEVRLAVRQATIKLLAESCRQ